MAVVSRRIHLSSRGDSEVLDITRQVQEEVRGSGLKAGTVTVSVIGSTCGLTTCEFEPGLVEDLPALFERLIPPGHYHHDRTWQDGNGHSHLRASLLGPSLTLPFGSSGVVLGTWQQIVFIDFDTRPRSRELVVQILGE